MSEYAFARPPREERARHWSRAAAWTVAVGAAHFMLPLDTHLYHVWHILLGGFLLIPIFHGAAADWKRGGVVAASVVSLVYGAHLLWSWSASPMANLDQVAVLGFYFVAGLAGGELFRREAVRHAQRDAIIRRAYLEEQARLQERPRMVSDRRLPASTSPD
jgi:apolipoprotein N-acyltransferase